jgi:hypothetical protein
MHREKVKPKTLSKRKSVIFTLLMSVRTTSPTSQVDLSLGGSLMQIPDIAQSSHSSFRVQAISASIEPKEKIFTATFLVCQH